MNIPNKDVNGVDLPAGFIDALKLRETIPSIVVKIDFTNTGTFVQIPNDYIEGVSINDNLEGTNGFAVANTASLTFDNHDRAFSPSRYAAYDPPNHEYNGLVQADGRGNLRPGRPVYIGFSIAAFPGVEVPLIYGNVDSSGFREKIGIANNNSVAIKINDYAKKLIDKKVAGEEVLIGTKYTEKDVVYVNKKISDPADTANSLVHLIAGLAGISSSDIIAQTIPIVIDYVEITNDCWSEIALLAEAVRGVAFFSGEQLYFGDSPFFAGSGTAVGLSLGNTDFGEIDCSDDFEGIKNKIKLTYSTYKKLENQTIWLFSNSDPQTGYIKGAGYVIDPANNEDIVDPDSIYKCQYTLYQDTPTVTAGMVVTRTGDADKTESTEVVKADNVELHTNQSGYVDLFDTTTYKNAAVLRFEDETFTLTYCKITGEPLVKDTEATATFKDANSITEYGTKDISLDNKYITRYEFTDPGDSIVKPHFQVWGNAALATMKRPRRKYSSSLDYPMLLMRAGIFVDIEEPIQGTGVDVTARVERVEISYSSQMNTWAITFSAKEYIATWADALGAHVIGAPGSRAISNRKLFTDQPVAPYSAGDRWEDASVIRTCKAGVSRAPGDPYVAADWINSRGAAYRGSGTTAAMNALTSLVAEDTFLCTNSTPAYTLYRWTGSAWTAADVTSEQIVGAMGDFVAANGATGKVVELIENIAASTAFIAKLGTDAIALTAGGKLYVGAGNYNNVDTPIFLGMNSGVGKVSFGTKLTWDGSALSIDGTITATLGSIGGFTIGAHSITGGNLVLADSGNITAGLTNEVVRISADNATYRLWIGNADPASASFKVTKLGALTATGVTVTGAINATTGTLTTLTVNGTITVGTGGSIVGTGFSLAPTASKIGGFTLTATTIYASNLTFTSGVANTAHILCGTGATAGGINSANASGDIAFWAGSTFANRATANFTVTAGGSLTAKAGTLSGLTVNGTITVGTGGSIVGTGFSLTPTGSTIGGFTINATSISSPNIVITSGVANVANIMCGTGATAGGLGSPNTGTDVAIWAGKAFADRATAPFHVHADGALTATSATITGAITATSGYLANMSVNGTLTLTTGGTIVGTGYSFGPTSSTIGGFTIGITDMSAANLKLTSGTSANITVGTGIYAGGLATGSLAGDILIWAGKAFADRATAPFRISASGALTATSGLIAGLSMAEHKLYLGAGNFYSADTPFYVDDDGDFSLGDKLSWNETTNVLNISGTLNSTDGAVGGWILGETVLKSAAVGTARIEIDSANMRYSIIDSANATKVAMGYLGSLKKNGATWVSTKAYVIGEYVNVGGVVYKCILGHTNKTPPNVTYWAVSSDTYTSSDYGFWITPGLSAVCDGALEIKNGDMTARDASFKLLQASTEVARFGADTGTIGLHLYHANGAVRLSNGGTDSLVVTTDNGYVEIGPRNTGYSHFYTDRVAYFFNKDIQPVSLTIYGQAAGFASTGIAKVITGAGTDSNTVYIKDGSAQLKERTIQAGVWSYNYNQNLLTSSLPSFAGLTITGTSYGFAATGIAKVATGAGTDSNVVYIKDGSAQLKERTIQVGVWTYNYNQNLLTSSLPSFAGLTITGTSYGFAATGIAKVATGAGADSNTVYIKDGSAQLKERTIQAGVWSYNYNQNLLTTSAPTFASLTLTGHAGLTLSNGSLTVVGAINASHTDYTTGFIFATSTLTQSQTSVIQVRAVSTGIVASGWHAGIEVVGQGTNANSNVATHGIHVGLLNSGTGAVNIGYWASASTYSFYGYAGALYNADAVTFNSTLNVAGATTLSSTLKVTGITTMGTNLRIPTTLPAALADGDIWIA